MISSFVPLIAAYACRMSDIIIPFTGSNHAKSKLYKVEKKIMN